MSETRCTGGCLTPPRTLPIKGREPKPSPAWVLGKFSMIYVKAA
jgi:hypothetical protein